jgi:N-acetylneuraminate synthase/sialic acid synthase
MNLNLTDEALIIAEVGQNHQGSLESALEYIKVFADAGADVIKFQTRNNKYLFSKDAYNKVYDSDNSFGNTYGEHREYLELPIDKLKDLKDECEKHGSVFMSTPFDEPSLRTLLDIKTEILKIASFDLGNISLAEEIGKSGVSVVLSTGGGTLEHIKATLKTFEKYTNEIGLLHCVSQYPCEYNILSLQKIKNLKLIFSNVTVGLSDHFNGILSGPIAYTMGARIFEKHVTFNRAWKGTDHSFSLELEGFRRFVRDIKRVPKMIEMNESNIGQEPVFKKLGKIIVAKRDIKTNSIISLEDLKGQICNVPGIPIRELSKLIGKTSTINFAKDNPISLYGLA